MSEPVLVMNDLQGPTSSRSMDGPSMFQGSQINSLQGGNFYTVQGMVHQNTVYIHNHGLPPEYNPEEEIDKAIEMLEKLVNIPVDFRAIHQDIVDKRTRDTGEAIKSEVEVQEWSEKSCGVLWLIGGPGAGKTYLTCTFIEWSEDLAEQPSNKGMAVAFAYLRYTEKLTAWDVVLDVIIQLVDSSRDFPAVAALVRDTLQPRRRKKGRPSFEELVQLLRSIVKVFPKARIIIDGIDEMLDDVQWCLVEVFSSLEAQVLFTSRPIKPLEDQLRELKGDQVVFKTVTAESKDLDLFINDVLKRTPSLLKLLTTNGVKDEVIAAIKTKAAGMFLHASLQVELLRHCRTLHDVYETIEQFPPQLEQLYENTLKRIPESDITLARLILLWVVHAKGSFFISDLQQAIAVSPHTFRFERNRSVSEEDIVSLCRGLVTIETQTRQVRLIHFTARDILLQYLSRHFPHPHDVIVKTCLARLEDCGLQQSSIETFGEFKEFHRQHPLVDYVDRNIEHHIKEATRTNGDLWPRIEAFVRGCESYPSLDEDGETVETTEPVHLLSALHVAAWFGMADLVLKLIFDEGVDVNTRTRCTGGLGWSALMAAAVEGHHKVVDVLLNHPEIDVNMADHYGITAFWAACYKGKDSVLKTLVAVPGIDLRAAPESLTPLLAACYKGHLSTVQILVDIPAIDFGRGPGDTGHLPLGMAAEYGHEEIVSALLTRPEIDPNSLDHNGCAAMHYAAGLGRAGAVKALLKVTSLGIINHRSATGWSPLLWASDEGHVNVLELLASVPGIDLSSTHAADPFYSPLINAVSNDHEAVVKFWIGAPAIDVNHENSAGDTPLVIASTKGYDAIVKALLAAPGILINRTDKDGNTALMQASYHGHESIVRLLLDTPGIDAAHLNNVGSSAIHYASSGGHPSIVKILLQYVGTILASQPNSNGWSPILLAASNGYVEVVAVLSKTPGIDIWHLSKSGGNVLTHAAENGRSAVVELLLAIPGAPVTHTDDGGNTALILAARDNRAEVAQMLINDRRIDINHQNSVGKTALWTAAAGGHVAIVKLLLAAPAIHLNLSDEHGTTPLMQACYFGHLPIVQLLLDDPATNVTHLNRLGSSALQYAAACGHSSIVEILLKVVDINHVNHQNSAGSFPLLMAANGGHVAVVDLLITVPGIKPWQVTQSKDTTLTLAAVHGHLEVLKSLLALPGAPINQGAENNNTPLMFACHTGRVDVVRLLMDQPHVDVNHANTLGSTAIHLASAEGHVSIVQMLVDYAGTDSGVESQSTDPTVRLSDQSEYLEGVVSAQEGSPGGSRGRTRVDVNKLDNAGMTPMGLACRTGKDAVVKFFLRAGIDPNGPADEGGKPPLLIAARNGHPDVVKTLLAVPGIEVNKLDDSGSSSLSWAASLGRDDVVDVLLEVSGIDVNTRCDGGWIATSRAAYRGRINVVKKLLAYPSTDLTIKTAHGETILLYTLSYHLQKNHAGLSHEKDHDPEPVALILLDHPTIQDLAHLPDDEGWTPLMYAAMFGYSTVVKALLVLPGVEVGARTKDGRSALGVALEGGHQDVVQQLRDAGAVE